MKINTFFSRKKISVIFLLVFLFQIASILINPLNAYAADQYKAQNEYTSYQAYRIMAYNCAWADRDGQIFTDPSSWMPTGVTIGVWIPYGTNVPVGSGFSGNNNAEVNCNDGRWIVNALNIWGYKSPKEFLDDLVKNSDASQNKGLKIEPDGAYTKMGNSGQNAGLTEVITKTLKNKKIDTGGLTPAIQYYAWLQNFVSQCSGKFSTTDPGNQGGGTVSIPTDYWVDEKGEIVKGFLIYNKRGAAIGDQPIAVGTAIKEDGRDSCDSIAQKVASGINNGEGAKAYAVYAKEGNVIPVNPTGTANPGQADECAKQLRPFGWVLCPVLGLASSVYDTFVGFINSILFFSTEKYAESGLQKSWAIFVRLANAVLVLVGLIMLAGQIFSFEIFSAYTVKKVLPRLVIGAILIQLSWFIFTIMAQIVNALGSGVYWLLLAPFGFDTGGGMVTFFQAVSQDPGNQTLETLVQNNFGATAAVAGAAVVGAIVVGSGAWISVIVAFVGILISILVALVTLMLRESLLIICLAISPIAIAAWILPSTNNLWNLWWKTYSRLLMMYPLIMLLFAGGTIAAHVLSQADKAGSMALSTLTGLKFFSASPQGNNTYLFLLLEIIAFFAPVFMISMTFKFAGQAFGSISNITSKFGNKAQSKVGGWGDDGKKLYKGWRTSKYDTNATGVMGKYRNASARLSAGGIPIGKRNLRRAAGAGIAYDKEQKEQADFLMALEYDAIQGDIIKKADGTIDYDHKAKTQYKQQLKFLATKGMERGADGDAAMRLAVSKGRLDALDEMMVTRDATTGDITGTNAEGVARIRQHQMDSSTWAGSVAQAGRSDIVDPSDARVSAAGIKEARGYDKSFWKPENEARRSKIKDDTIQAMAQYENWIQLDEGAQQYVKDRMGSSWTPPTGPTFGGGATGGGGQAPAPAPTNGPPSTQPSTGPTIITPGSPGSNIPPGSHPGGPNFNP